MPTGQVIAQVAGSDVTEREVDQELRSANIPLEEAGFGVRNAATERVIRRKILAAEALKRGIDREGSYHFALRRARDELLAQAFRQRVRDSIAPPSNEAVQREIALRPWLYRQRRRIMLTSSTGSDTLRQAEVDTIDLSDAVGSALSAVQVGGKVRVGERTWTIASAIPVAVSESDIVGIARQSLLDQAADSALAKVTENYRQSGQVRYQVGKGLAADVAK